MTLQEENEGPNPRVHSVDAKHPPDGSLNTAKAPTLGPRGTSQLVTSSAVIRRRHHPLREAGRLRQLLSVSTWDPRHPAGAGERTLQGSPGLHREALLQIHKQASVSRANVDI